MGEVLSSRVGGIWGAVTHISCTVIDVFTVKPLYKSHQIPNLFFRLIWELYLANPSKPRVKSRMKM